MKYQIPVKFSVEVTVEVEAYDIEAAMSKAENKVNSFQIYSSDLGALTHLTNAKVFGAETDEDECKDLNPKQKFTVYLKKVETAEIEVEAHSEEEACETAEEMIENGEVENEWDIQSVDVEAADAIIH